MPKQVLRPHTGPDYISPCTAAELEHYRFLMRALHRDTALPPVIYKGETYPAREL